MNVEERFKSKKVLVPRDGPACLCGKLPKTQDNRGKKKQEYGCW